MSSLDHDEAEALLADYVDDLLTTSRADLVDAHLRDCARCRSQLAILHALDLRDRYEALASAPSTDRPGAHVVPFRSPHMPWRSGAMMGRGRELALVAVLMLAVGMGAGRFVWRDAGGGGRAGQPEDVVPMGVTPGPTEPSVEVPRMRFFDRVGGEDYLSTGQIAPGSDLVVEVNGATPFGVVGDDVVPLSLEQGVWVWEHPALDDGDGMVVAVADTAPDFDPEVLIQPDWETRLAQNGVLFSFRRVSRKGDSD